MIELTLITDTDNYRKALQDIYEESVPHFMEVEGRKPLSPFEDIYETAPEIPREFPAKCFAFVCGGEAAGYCWVMEVEPDDLYYILEFIVGERFRKQKIGTNVLKLLDKMYNKKFGYSELLVSAKNYMGLNFWVNSGYTQITAVFPPEAQGTESTELNLRKAIKQISDNT
ncbi:MAG: GNAT family N-acetyltransferase [Ruminococcus sp.]|nr:GNAT family N-acetyltransferase [Ruminococcus sp.]